MIEQGGFKTQAPFASKKGCFDVIHFRRTSGYIDSYLAKNLYVRILVDDGCLNLLKGCAGIGRFAPEVLANVDAVDLEVALAMDELQPLYAVHRGSPFVPLSSP